MRRPKNPFQEHLRFVWGGGGLVTQQELFIDTPSTRHWRYRGACVCTPILRFMSLLTGGKLLCPDDCSRLLRLAGHLLTVGQCTYAQWPANGWTLYCNCDRHDVVARDIGIALRPYCRLQLVEDTGSDSYHAVDTAVRQHTDSLRHDLSRWSVDVCRATLVVLLTSGDRSESTSPYTFPSLSRSTGASCRFTLKLLMHPYPDCNVHVQGLLF
jgi:hypothetical protein